MIILETTAYAAFILYLLSYVYSAGVPMVSGLFAGYGLTIFILLNLFINKNNLSIANLSIAVLFFILIGMITVTGVYYNPISRLQVSSWYFVFNIIISAMMSYVIYTKQAVLPLTMFTLICFINIVVMLTTQTTDGFTVNNL